MVVNLLGAADRSLDVVADIFGADYLFEFRLMDKTCGLFARATKNENAIGRLQGAGNLFDRE